MIHISADLPDLEKIEKKLGDQEKKAPAVLASAINQAMKPINKGIAKIAGEQYTYRPDRLNAPDVDKATRKKLCGTLTYTGKGIPLDRFRVSKGSHGERSYRWGYMSESPGQALRVKVRKDGPYKPIRNAFSVKLHGTKIFHRSDDSDLSEKMSARLRASGIIPTRYNAAPIERMYSTSIPQMVGHRKIKPEVQKLANEELAKAVEAGIKKTLAKADAS